MQAARVATIIIFQYRTQATKSVIEENGSKESRMSARHCQNDIDIDRVKLWLARPEYRRITKRKCEASIMVVRRDSPIGFYFVHLLGTSEFLRRAD